jgi:hypothetical protein
MEAGKRQKRRDKLDFKKMKNNGIIHIGANNGQESDRYYKNEKT